MSEYRLGDWQGVADAVSYRLWRDRDKSYCDFCGQPLESPKTQSPQETLSSIADAVVGDPLGYLVAFHLVVCPTFDNRELAVRLGATVPEVAAARERVAAGSFFAPASWRGEAARGGGGDPPPVGTFARSAKSRLARGPFISLGEDPEDGEKKQRDGEDGAETPENGRKRKVWRPKRSTRGGVQSEIGFE